MIRISDAEYVLHIVCVDGKQPSCNRQKCTWKKNYSFVVKSSKDVYLKQKRSFCWEVVNVERRSNSLYNFERSKCRGLRMQEDWRQTSLQNPLNISYRLFLTNKDCLPIFRLWAKCYHVWHAEPSGVMRIGWGFEISASCHWQIASAYAFTFQFLTSIECGLNRENGRYCENGRIDCFQPIFIPPEEIWSIVKLVRKTTMERSAQQDRQYAVFWNNLFSIHTTMQKLNKTAIMCPATDLSL